MSDLRVALEDALTEDPDDRAAHSALADWLADQPDPALAARGEFITVQLALEDAALTGGQRERLQDREAELLAVYEADWLGPLGAYFRDYDSPAEARRKLGLANRTVWRRGWLDELYRFRGWLQSIRLLVRCPAARLLRSLHVQHVPPVGDSRPEPGELFPEGCDYPTLHVLRQAPFLAGLRRLTLGRAVDVGEECYRCDAVVEGIADLVALCPRLESLRLFARDQEQARLFALPTLTNLTELVLYHQNQPHPLDRLASNPALARLHTLRIHPGHSGGDSFLPRQSLRPLFASPHLTGLRRLHLYATALGDEGCRDLVNSGLLARLEVLDLRFGCVTDAGARTLAACPDLRRLQSLSLEHNRLTDEGRALLGGLGFPVRGEPQVEIFETDDPWAGEQR